MHRLTLLLLAGALASSAQVDEELPRLMKRLIDAYSIVEQNAADPVSAEQAFYQGAIPGLLRKLDPHSAFFDPEQFEQLRKLETSTQKGFGSVVSILPGRIIVLQTLPGTPSQKSGLAPGDEILAVNGYDISRLDMEQMIALLTQSRQQQARLEVRRPGTARLLQFVLTPEEMLSPSVDRTYFLAAGIGYIRVSSFDENTATLVKEAIEKLGGDHLRGLVLDFRNNPGGLLTSAIQMASLFLRPGQKLVTVRGRAVPEKTETVPPTAKPYGFKLTLLINGKTASASEIVAGAMQDHDRATILGEPSFGKGLVQSVYPLARGAGLALTTALYYTPSGRSIQKPLDAARFELSGVTARPQVEQQYRTDSGRPVKGGGGLTPDVLVYPPPVTRLRAVLDASGSFTNFATEYLSRKKIEDDFEVTPALLDEYQLFLSQRGIQPGVSEWSSEREFIRNRLKTELFNQAFGVEKGDEIEAQRDPAILRAIAIIGG
jgi:carboxyl-terminal processing protease